MPLRIVWLETPYLNVLGLQEMFCAQPAHLNIQSFAKDLALGHERLASIQELPRENVRKASVW
jgi:hypothetical protein